MMFSRPLFITLSLLTMTMALITYSVVHSDPAFLQPLTPKTAASIASKHKREGVSKTYWHFPKPHWVHHINCTTSEITLLGERPYDVLEVMTHMTGSSQESLEQGEQGENHQVCRSLCAAKALISYTNQSGQVEDLTLKRWALPGHTLPLSFEEGTPLTEAEAAYGEYLINPEGFLEWHAHPLHTEFFQ